MTTVDYTLVKIQRLVWTNKHRDFRGRDKEGNLTVVAPAENGGTCLVRIRDLSKAEALRLIPWSKRQRFGLNAKREPFGAERARELFEQRGPASSFRDSDLTPGEDSYVRHVWSQLDSGEASWMSAFFNILNDRVTSGSVQVRCDRGRKRELILRLVYSGGDVRSPTYQLFVSDNGLASEAAVFTLQRFEQGWVRAETEGYPEEYVFRVVDQLLRALSEAVESSAPGEFRQAVEALGGTVFR